MVGRHVFLGNTRKLLALRLPSLYKRNHGALSRRRHTSLLLSSNSDVWALVFGQGSLPPAKIPREQMMPQNGTSGARASPVHRSSGRIVPWPSPTAAASCSRAMCGAPLGPAVFSTSLGLTACCRGRHLEESLEYLEFMQNAEEEEAWISEKEAMVARGGSGDTLAMTQVSHRLND